MAECCLARSREPWSRTGTFELGDISAFNAAFTYPVQGIGPVTVLFNISGLELFSFLPGSNFVSGINSSFDFEAAGPIIGESICSGAAAAFDLCGDANGAVDTKTPWTRELPSWPH